MPSIPTTEDYRPVGTRRHPLGVKHVVSEATGASPTKAYAVLSGVDGEVVLLALEAGDLATDTTYTLTIYDDSSVIDKTDINNSTVGNIVYQKSGINDNGVVYVTLYSDSAAADKRFFLFTSVGEFLIEWSWSTAQGAPLSQGFFKTRIVYKTD